MGTPLARRLPTNFAKIALQSNPFPICPFLFPSYLLGVRLGSWFDRSFLAQPSFFSHLSCTANFPLSLILKEHELTHSGKYEEIKSEVQRMKK